MKIFKKNKLLVIIPIILMTNFLNAQDKSPFEKYDPNKENKVQQLGVINNSSGLSQEQEMQVRDLIFQELSLKNESMDFKKESGLIEYDDSEILYLGKSEVLKGIAKKQYIILNSSTNLFRYIETEKYKKVVTFEERMALLEEETGINQ